LDPSLLLTEGVQAGQNLGVVIMVQTNAADQELLVYLPDDRAGAAGLTLSHRDGHSKGAQGPLNLHTQGGRKGRKVTKALRKHVYSSSAQAKEEMSHYTKNRTASKACICWHSLHSLPY